MLEAILFNVLKDQIQKYFDFPLRFFLNKNFKNDFSMGRDDPGPGYNKSGPIILL